METEQYPKLHGLKIHRLVGRGNDTSVYEAKLRGESVAIKVYQNASKLGGERKNQIEYAQLSKLDHPNILRIKEVWLNQDKPAVIYEYARGDSLDWLQQRLPTELPEIGLLFTVEILNGLHYLHSKNVFHGNLKPENVILTHTQRVVLTDFSLQGSGSTAIDLMSVKRLIWFLSTRMKDPVDFSQAPKPTSISDTLWDLLKHPFQTAWEFRIALENYLTSVGLDHLHFSEWLKSPDAIRGHAHRKMITALERRIETLISENVLQEMPAEVRSILEKTANHLRTLEPTSKALTLVPERPAARLFDLKRWFR